MHQHSRLLGSGDVNSCFKTVWHQAVLKPRRLKMTLVTRDAKWLFCFSLS